MSDSDSELESQQEDSFLSRWSRRKTVAKVGEADTATVDEKLVADEALDVADEVAVVEDNLPGDSDMPPVESLDEDSDYSGFMSPKVSDELRNMALRKLFLSGMFSSRDGLDDYDDDFTSFEKLGDVITAEMRHQMERMKEALDDSDDLTEEATDDTDVATIEGVEESGVEKGMEAEPEMSVSAADRGDEQDGQADENEQTIEDHNVNEDK